MKSFFAASACAPMIFLGIGLAVGAAAKPLRATAPPTKTESEIVAPSTVKLLADDPLLQTSVTVDVVEKPLGDVLHDINPTLKLDLSAERDISDQRVTLHVTGQPAYVLMAQLLALLSHDAEHPRGYYWESLDRPPGERRHYQLWRDGASVARERDALDLPHRRIAVILRDMRLRAQTPIRSQSASQGQSESHSALPDDPINKAVRGLTDDQIDSLVSGETLPLDLSLFPDEVAAMRHIFQDQPVPREPPTPAIRVTPADLDEEMGRLDLTGRFFLSLDGFNVPTRILDATSTPTDPDPVLTPLPPDTGPQVDLSPFLSLKVATPQQRSDLGFTLQALAKAAQINVYQESYLRTSTLNGGFTDGLTHPPLAVLQGSLPRLIAQICTLWNYSAQQTPDGYLFWSRTWAQDRSRDVPERLIAPWRKRLQENGRLSIYDRGEIDSVLTWPQVALTLDQALPEASVDDSIGTYRIFNLFGSLTPLEQTESLSPDGLAVSKMGAAGQKALSSSFQSQLRNAPSSQVDTAVLRFQTEDAPELNVQRVILSLDADHQSLLGKRCYLPLKAVKKGT